MDEVKLTLLELLEEAGYPNDLKAVTVEIPDVQLRYRSASLDRLNTVKVTLHYETENAED